MKARNSPSASAVSSLTTSKRCCTKAKRSWPTQWNSWGGSSRNNRDQRRQSARKTLENYINLWITYGNYTKLQQTPATSLSSLRSRKLVLVLLDLKISLHQQSLFFFFGSSSSLFQLLFMLFALLAFISSRICIYRTTLHSYIPD